MIIKHDESIIKFIETFPCYSDTIARLFYNSQRAANRRLTYLHDYGCIKRSREHASKKYFYWCNRREPNVKHRKHYDLIAKAFIWVIKQDYNVKGLYIQKEVNGVKPDLLLHIEQGGRENILPVEVECSNNIWNTVKKYEDTGFKKLLLFCNRSFTKETQFIDVIDINLKELD